MQYKIGFIGEKDAVYGFGMLGLDIRYVQDPSEVKTVIKQLVEDHYAVIFITEKLAQSNESVIRSYDESFLPAIILIPSDVESESIGLQRIQENVKKAVGQNIL